MKNIVYIASRPFIPSNGGREKMILQGVAALAKVARLTLIVFHSETEVIEDEPYIKIGVHRVFKIKLSSPIQILKNKIQNINISFQEAMYLSDRSKKSIDEIIDNISPVSVVCDMIRTAQFLRKNLKYKVFIDLDDLLSERYRQQLCGDVMSGSVFGTYENRVPDYLKSITFFFSKKILRHEMKKIKEKEIIAPECYNAVLMTSHIECERLKKITKKNNIYANPPAGYISNDSWSPVNGDEGCVRVLFLGNMNAPHNIEALIYIKNEVMPEAKKVGLNIKVSVVGAYQNSIKSIFYEDGFEFHGYVDDLIYEANKCNFALLPVAYGTGVKTKILDAMGIGIPVVTNWLGLEGIDAENNKDIIVANNVGEMIDGMKKIIESRDFALCVGESGKNYVIKNHNNEILSKNYTNLILNNY